MDVKLLQHVGYYGHIYRFVAENSKTMDEIRDYLTSCGENASTVRTQLQMLTGEKSGMFRVNGEMVSVDSAMAREFVGEINKIFEPLLLSETDRDAEIAKLKAENEKLKKQLEGYKKRASETRKLDKKKVEAARKVLPKVLVIDSTQVGPITEAKDSVFLDTKACAIDAEEYVSRYGLLKDSYYRELDEDHDLTQLNHKKKTFRNVFNNAALGKRLEELKMIRAGLSQKDPSLKERIRESFHVSDKEAETQIKYLQGRALSVHQILDDQKLTNQEKIALYAFNSPYRNTDLERLLNYAGDECVDANWLITLLESPELGNDYENVMNLIRQCSKASEWAMKKRLAEELLSGQWFITAVYQGKETKFQLVPVEELNEIRVLLGVEPKDFEHLLTEENKGVSEAKKDPVIKKDDFVRTMPIDAAEMDKAMPDQEEQ